MPPCNDDQARKVHRYCLRVTEPQARLTFLNCGHEFLDNALGIACLNQSHDPDQCPLIICKLAAIPDDGAEFLFEVRKLRACVDVEASPSLNLLKQFFRRPRTSKLIVGQCGTRDPEAGSEVQLRSLSAQRTKPPPNSPRVSTFFA